MNNEKKAQGQRDDDSKQKDSKSMERRNARLVLQLLNKLTPTNFNVLVPPFIQQAELHFTEPSLEYTVKSIVNRAACDIRFADMLAHLCLRFLTDLPSISTAFGTNTNIDSLSFRNILWQDMLDDVSRRQVHVDQRHSQTLAIEQDDCSPSKETYEQRMDAVYTRHFFVGKVRFMGYLCNHNVLREDEILYLLEMLLDLSGIVSNHTKQTINEEALECICVLLSTTGQRLEGTVISFERLQTTWKLLDDLVHQQQADRSRLRGLMSFRSEHMVLELLELRASGWNSPRYSARRRQELIARPLPEKDRVHIRAKDRRKASKNKGRLVHFGEESAPPSKDRGSNI
jgi:hypothetical protein